MEAEPSSSGSSPMDYNPIDQAGSGSPIVPDPPCIVPTDSLAVPKCDDSPEETEGLKTDANFSPTKQLIVNLCKLKGKYTSCPSDAYTACKASKDRDAVHCTPKPIPLSGSPMDPNDTEHCQVVEHSLGSTCKQSNTKVNSNSIMNSKTVKATVRNVLELKLSAKHLKSDISGGSSSDTELLKCSEEQGMDKPGSHSREGPAETDSVLEAAVNSILDC